jgi:DNA-binding transcriptional LysR family regulator
VNNALYDVFLAVFDTHSVSKAADMLNVSQSGVSSALNRLRAQLRDPLFVRTSRGMEPTLRSIQIADHVRSAMDSLARVHAAPATFDPAQTDYEFSILTGDILEGTVLRRTIPTLAKSAPAAKLRAISKRPHEIEAALASREIDLAMGYFPQLETNNVMTTGIARFTFAPFVRPQHPLAGRQLSLEEFCAAPHIAVDAESSLPNIVEQWLATRQIHRNIVVRTSHFFGVPQIIMEADLIAVVPTDLTWRWFFEGHAVPVSIPFSLPTSEIKLYWHRTVHEDPRHRWWRGIVAEALRRPVEPPHQPSELEAARSSVVKRIRRGTNRNNERQRL